LVLNSCERKDEEKRLIKVIKIIESQIKELEEKLNVKQQRVEERRREVIKSLGKSVFDEAQQIQIMYAEEQDSKVNLKVLKRFRKLVLSPYFARIDFRESERVNTFQIYIGISSLIDPETDELLIYDWRAPVSSLFYDYGLGEAAYNSPEGEVRGEVLLKRQFKIADQEIQYMFDTDLKIDDEILQKTLSENATGRMKQIVNSIQREQNRIIRDDRSKLLLVSGPAGSGKTTIALHRAAYLLYKYRDTLGADNILIFSPNQIFSDYISDVLPELGEDNMMQVTFQEYAERYLMGDKKIEDINEQIDYFLSAEKEKKEYKIRVSGTELKSSKDFIELLKKYVDQLNRREDFDDIIYRDRVVILGDELKELWDRYNYLPYKRRLLKLKMRIYYLLRTVRKERYSEVKERLSSDPERMFTSKNELVRETVSVIRDEFKPLRKKIQEDLSFDLYDLYLKLFENKDLIESLMGDEMKFNDEWEGICELTSSAVLQNRILQEDLLPLLFLKKELTGKRALIEGIEYVFIDEAQDYSLLHYEIIKEIFPDCHFTILGDVNQSIHPYMGLGGFEELYSIFGIENRKIIPLKKSYRSTEEITSFADALLNEGSIRDGGEVIRKSLEKPLIVKTEKELMQEAVVSGIKELKGKGISSAAIICKTEAESIHLFNQLKERIDIKLLTAGGKEFRSGTVILPAYLAKGLEFDAVVIYMNEKNRYDHQNELNLLYTVCTRALHYLRIYYAGSLGSHVEKIDEELYIKGQY